jgi:hypothetical protein
MGRLASDGGIIKIGDEYIAYESIRGGSMVGVKRSFMRTQEQNHNIGSNVFPVFYLPVTTLSDSVDREDWRIATKSAGDFPIEGYLKCGDEIIGYTSNRGSFLAMPQGKDNEGLLRGAFGSEPENHSSREIAYFWPSRYWHHPDISTGSDQLPHFTVTKNAPNAKWQNIYWKAETPAARTGVRILARFDGKPSWDGKVTNQPGGLFSFSSGEEGSFQGASGNSLEMRIYFVYTSQAHRHNDWKEQAKMQSIEVQYWQPTTVWESR